MKYLTLSAEKFATLFCILTVFVLGTSNLSSQCALSCNGTTQVSLSSACDAEITPNMILSDDGASCPGGDLIVQVSDDYGMIPGVDVVTTAYMGQTLSAMIIDQNSGNSCWGYIIIEDKLGPMIKDGCPATIIMDCPDMNAYPGPTFADNCDGDLTPVLLSEDIETPCLPGIIKVVTRTYSAQDDKGNISANTCTINFRLRRFIPQRVRYPDSLTVRNGNPLQCDDAQLFDVNGNGRIDEGEIPVEVAGAPFYRFPIGPGVFDTVSLFPYPDIYCNTIVTFEDLVLPKIGCTQKIMRRWVINEWHCDGERTIDTVQLIEIVDDKGPEILVEDGRCLLNGSSTITLSTNTLISAPGGTYGDFNCGASIKLPLPNVTDNCSENISVDLTHNEGHIQNYQGESVVIPMGTSVVLFTVYDDCYNSSQCHIPVEIIDNTPPIVVCDQNTTVSVTSGGKALIPATSFDDGSYDDCKMHCSMVRRMQTGECECRLPEFCDMTYVGNFKGSNYYLSNYNIGASIAKSRAQAYGGSLAILNSSDEQDWLVEAVRPTYYGEFWLGMKRHGSGFLWDDHTSVGFNNFDGGTYPDAGGNCVILNQDNNWEAQECANEWRYVLEIPEGCGFSSNVQYCCGDVGQPDHMVVYRVVDFYGNYNDCMVNVFVQDKSAPALNCPDNRTVDCDYIYDLNNLDSSFGELELGESCGPTIIPTVTPRVNECGVGSITRLWTAVASPDDLRELTHCKQIITIENNDPFNGNVDLVCPKQDTIIYGCDHPDNFGPDVMGSPEFLGDACDLIGADYNDQLFTFNENEGGEACFKILRTWKIVDWCQMNLATNDFYNWSCVQVIKISNTSRPIITGCKAEDVCTYDSDCSEGLVNFEIFGEDDCTTAENLRWTYSVFANGNTSAAPVVTESGTGGHVVASGKFPVGSHIIRWAYSDRCGNVSTCDQPFSVSNCKAATAYCLNGLAVDLMPIDTDGDGTPDDGMIELWASDFDAGSSHPCGYPVHLSFSPDVNETNKTFGCVNNNVSGLGDNYVDIYATVYTPNGDAIQTRCNTLVNIQDNMGVCTQNIVVNVDGVITTETTQAVEAVSVALDGSPMSTSTDAFGQYAFPSMPTGGDYMVNPYSNDNPLGGISTLDLIKIQRHILDIEKLNSPYKLIAADVDGNKVIDGVDLIELRKLILGVYQELPQNDSWRFVDGSYEFADSTNPFADPFSEDYRIDALDANMVVNFIAIKVGDVNDSMDEVLVNGETATNVGNSALNLDFEGIVEISSNEITLPMTLSNASGLRGFQYEMSFDSDNFQVTSLEGIGIDISESNYLIEDDRILVSWTGDDNITEATIALRITINSELAASDFDLENTQITAETYDNNLESHRIQLMSGDDGDRFQLFQNIPNPFTDVTELSFRMTNDAKVDFSITNIQGRIINAFSKDYPAGINSVMITKDQLGASGIYYLTVETAENSQTIKIVLID